MQKQKLDKKAKNELSRFEQRETVTIRESGKNPQMRILIVTPTLGMVRVEWAISRYGQAIPCNWSTASTTLGIGFYVPMHYLVADAQNLGAAECVAKGYEWMLLWEDDVIPPLDALLQLNNYMKAGDIPVVSGLYFTKGLFSEPILYRGIGTSCYTGFKIGDKVWATGVPTGFLLIHSSILKLMFDESEDYTVLSGQRTKRIFDTQVKVYLDPKTHTYTSGRGTSDLIWCKRVMEDDVLRRAGFSKIGRKKYPFLCDTNIFCKHIDITTGKQYPG